MLQFVKVKVNLLSPVQLFGSSVHGIIQARILKWVAISFSSRFHIYALIYNILTFLTSL